MRKQCVEKSLRKRWDAYKSKVFFIKGDGDTTWGIAQTRNDDIHLFAEIDDLFVEEERTRGEK